jgi:hypothetical protein
VSSSIRPGRVQRAPVISAPCSPALPDEPPGDGAGISADEVGGFDQGSPLSRWALARYLVGRAIGESVGRSLLVVALVIFGLAAASEWGLHSTFLAVVLGILGLIVLLLRTGLRAILRRLTAAEHYEPIEARLRRLVADTRGDVLRELRRVGLPSHAVTLPLLALRLTGKRRVATLEKLRGFDVDRAVPRTRLDELHMLLRSGLGGS